MIKGKSNLSGKGYETKGEQGPSNSLAASSPAKVRRMVGDPKNVKAGRAAFTQDTPDNLAQSFEDLARVHAAKGAM